MKAKMDEIWKDIADIRGYQISNFGNVRSVDRIVNHPNSPNKQAIKKGQPIKPFINKGGYKEVVLLKKCFVGAGYNKVHRTIHRLVAQAFLENPNKYEEINHKDENKLNNNVNNLEWCSHIYNVRYGTGNKRSHESREQAIISIIDGIRTIYKSSKIAAPKECVSVAAIRYRVRKGYFKHKFGHSNKIDIWRLANAKEIELLGSSNFITIKDED